MIIERDVAVTSDDGLVLRADVFRPDDSEDRPVPVVLTQGPYGKGVPFQVGYRAQWEGLLRDHPDLLAGSSHQYLTWETVDPEIWVPWGYAVVRVDSRGAGRTPGLLDVFSPREVSDLYQAIEWAGTRPWSTGKVGLNGISYYAITQWLVAALRPPHLAAMVPWEGAGDYYRDVARHGGILSNAFLTEWYERQVRSLQHGNPTAPTDPWIGERASGPDEFSELALAESRRPPVDEVLARRLDGPYYRERSADWSRITVPFLSAASLAGFGLHQRGNFEAFVNAAAEHKHLETHPGRHEEWFYLAEGMAVQKTFLDRHLKGDRDGTELPPVLLRLRRPFTDALETRHEQEWPLARTRWTEAHLHSDGTALAIDAPAERAGTVTFEALGDPVTFRSAPLPADTEITGPLVLTAFVSSTTTDADLFVTVRAFAPDGREVDFPGTMDPRSPLAQGALRASHRKLDPDRSLPHRPWHVHDEEQPLVPGEVYELAVEIWPTSILLPAGFTLALTIGGRDFERPGPSDPSVPWTARGSGPFLHTHPEDRPADVYGGATTIHTGPATPSRLLLPIVPPA